MTARRLRLDGPDRLVALRDDVADVDAAASAPIGARVVLDVAPARAGLPVEGKVIDVRRTGGRFRIRIRLFSPSKAARLSMQALWEPAPGGH
jgi:hypothetical protein